RDVVAETVERLAELGRAPGDACELAVRAVERRAQKKEGEAERGAAKVARVVGGGGREGGRERQPRHHVRRDRRAPQGEHEDVPERPDEVDVPEALDLARLVYGPGDGVHDVASCTFLAVGKKSVT